MACLDGGLDSASALLDPKDAVMLWLDHETSRFQRVKDISVGELRANSTALAKLATLLKILAITTGLGSGRAQRSAHAGDSPSGWRMTWTCFLRMEVPDDHGGTSANAHNAAMQCMIQAGVVPVTWLQVLLEFQRDWARRDTYDAVIAIVKEHADAYGSGVEYAYTMVHGQVPDGAYTGQPTARSGVH
jgi:phosphoribulokinase